jgi:hypothetical protein
VSLTPIAIAFVLVAPVFVATSVVTVRWTTRDPGSGTRDPDPGTGTPFGAALRAAWLPATAEALFLTLLAALWFGSLGHGGWVVLFLLLGAIAGGGDRWAHSRLRGAPAGVDVRLLVASLLKYLLAGGLCAWCLT